MTRKINKPMFDAMLDHLGQLFAVSETSGRRTQKRNSQVGGGDQSRHLCGMARDLVPDDWTEAPAIIKAAKKLGLDAVLENDHIHIEADARTD